MKIYDLIKNELIGKYTYTKGNIKFKIEEVFQHYEDIQKHFNTEEDIKLTALKLIGKDEDGLHQEVVLANNRILDLFYFT
jgi:sarcosine oxidase delta subunit